MGRRYRTSSGKRGCSGCIALDRFSRRPGIESGCRKEAVLLAARSQQRIAALGPRRAAERRWSRGLACSPAGVRGRDAWRHTAQSDLRHRRVVGQRPPDCLLHGAEDGAALPKAHLRLGRVHVYIHFLRRHLDEKHRDRVPPDRQHGMIGLDRGISDRRILKPALVDEECDIAAVTAVEGRCAGVTGDADGGWLMVLT